MVCAPFSVSIVSACCSGSALKRPPNLDRAQVVVSSTVEYVDCVVRCVRNVQAGGGAMHGGMVEATRLEVRGQVNIGLTNL